MTELETTKLLTQLASGGLAMVAVSWVLERVERFQRLASEKKAWLVLGLTLVVALVAQAVLQFVPPAWIQAAEPFVKVVLVATTAWLTSQTYHAVQKRVSAGQSSDGAQG